MLEQATQGPVSRSVSLEHRFAHLDLLVIELLEIGAAQFRGEQFLITSDMDDVGMSGDGPESMIGLRLIIPVQWLLLAEGIQQRPSLILLEHIEV